MRIHNFFFYPLCVPCIKPQDLGNLILSRLHPDGLLDIHYELSRKSSCIATMSGSGLPCLALSKALRKKHAHLQELGPDLRSSSALPSWVHLVNIPRLFFRRELEAVEHFSVCQPYNIVMFSNSKELDGNLHGTFNMPTSYQSWVWEREAHINRSMVTCQGSTRYWNYLEVYWPCAGGLWAVNAIGTQLRNPIKSGLTRWRMAVLNK